MGIKEYRKRFILFLVFVMVFSFFGSAFAEQSSDIKGHWAEDELSIWLEAGFLKGYPDGSVKPNNPITRAEFVTLINKAFDLTVEADISFTDVTQVNWEYEQVAKAVAVGFIFGYEDGTFRASKYVTRQEAAVMLARLLDIDEDEDATNTYADHHAMATWSKGAVGALSALDVMTGYKNGTYQPERQLTRAEAVVILQRILDLLNEETTTTIIDEPGEYGSTESQTVTEGDLIIFSPGVTLHNMLITGDLIIGEEVGEGDVFLKQVTVQGMTIIQGGGENSIHLEDSIFLTITVDKQNGSVRIVAVGSTSVEEVFLLSGAILEETNGTASGFSHVYLAETLPKGSKVRLLGSFDSVEVFSQSVQIYVPRGAIGEFIIAEGSQTSIELGKEAQIVSLVLDAVVKVIGQGKITKAMLNEGAKGSTFANPPESMTGAGAPIPSSSGGGFGGGGNTGGGNTNIPVSDLSLSPKSLMLSVGGTGKLTTTIQPSNATNQQVTWSSSDEKVATVDNNGLVTAVGKGTATITATSVSNNSKTASVKVSVVDIIEASFEPGEVAIYNEPIGVNEDGEFIFIKELGKEFKLLVGKNVIKFNDIVSFYDGDEEEIKFSYPYENFWIPIKNLKGIFELNKFKTKDGNLYTAKLDWQEIYEVDLEFDGPAEAISVFSDNNENVPVVNFGLATTDKLIDISTPENPNHYAIKVKIIDIEDNVIDANNVKKMFRVYSKGLDDELQISSNSLEDEEFEGDEYIEEEITSDFNPFYVTTKWAEGRHTVIYVLQDDSIFRTEVYIEITSQDPATEDPEFILTSAAIENGEIPNKFSKYPMYGGEDISLPLAWAGAPIETNSFAIMMFDDAQEIKWAILNIPNGVTSLEEGASPSSLPIGSQEVKEFFLDMPGQYNIVIFALSALQSVEDFNQLENKNYNGVKYWLNDIILAETSLTGNFLDPLSNLDDQLNTVSNNEIDSDGNIDSEFDTDFNQEAVREPEDEAEDVQPVSESDLQDFESDTQDNPDTSNDPNLALEEEEIKEDISFE